MNDSVKNNFGPCFFRFVYTANAISHSISSWYGQDLFGVTLPTPVVPRADIFVWIQVLEGM